MNIEGIATTSGMNSKDINMYTRPTPGTPPSPSPFRYLLLFVC
jgi:hypothetical protein